MATIKISLREDYIKTDGTCAVNIETIVKRKRVRLKTGVFVNPENWDDIKSKIKGSSKMIKDDNLIIHNSHKRVTEIFVRYRLQHKELTPQLLKKEYANPTQYIDFYQFLRDEIKKNTGLLGANTIKTHYSMLNKMEGYKKTLTFVELDVDMVNGFKKHMRLKLKNGPNTINKTLGSLKVYVNIARRKKIITDSPFDIIKVKRTESDRTYLDPEELIYLLEKYRKKMFPNNLQKVLRAFLFSCVTGIRLSDIKVVKMEDIINNTLIYQPVKTRGHSKTIKTPLTKTAWELIGDASPQRIFGVIFEMYTDPVTNRHLKKISDSVNIEKTITFHCARHTFATNFLRETKNLAALQKLMGHGRISETMIYAHVLQDDINKEMEVFGNRF